MITPWSLIGIGQSYLITRLNNNNNTMEGADLDAKLRSDPYIERYYHGVFSSDEAWPVPWNLPASYVFNTDSSEGPGQHWICFFIDSDDSVDYMDSYGTAPIRSTYKWLKNNGFGPVRFNQKWLQGPSSTICWAYSIYFLATRSRGLQLEDILKRFHSYNFPRNDHIVMSLIWHGTPGANPRLPVQVSPPLQVSMTWRDLSWPSPSHTGLYTSLNPSSVPTLVTAISGYAHIPVRTTTTHLCYRHHGLSTSWNIFGYDGKLSPLL